MNLQFMIVIYTRFARQSLLYHEAKLHDRDLHELCSAVFIISLNKENNKREYKKNKEMKRKKHGKKRTYHTV